MIRKKKENRSKVEACKYMVKNICIIEGRKRNSCCQPSGGLFYEFFIFFCIF